MEKKLLIYGEQGLGDTLQFCRFAPAAAALGATVILEIPPTLAGVLRTLSGVSLIVVQGTPLPEFDVRCPMMSLPLALKITLASLPVSTNYLRSDHVKTSQWRKLLGPKSRPRIGLTWSGNPAQGNDANRSIRLADWITRLPREFDYYCVQKDIRREDGRVLLANPWISRLVTDEHDFSDTAALCETLDLIVSVCTSIAHLAAAIGRPTCVLLPFNPDWRWLLDRNDSPWYPTVTLYRQQIEGDWAGVLQRVAEDMRNRMTWPP